MCFFANRNLTIKREDFFSRILYIQSRRNHPPLISQTGIFIGAIVSGSLNIFIYRVIGLICKNLTLPCTVIVRRGNNLVSPTRAQFTDRRIICLDIVELINRIFTTTDGVLGFLPSPPSPPVPGRSSSHRSNKRRIRQLS